MLFNVTLNNGRTVVIEADSFCYNGEIGALKLIQENKEKGIDRTVAVFKIENVLYFYEQSSFIEEIEDE